LRYYCGYLLPDSNIVKGALLSKDLEKSRFFEGFTVFLSPAVKYECDSPAGKKELERLARFAAIGRIRLEDAPQATPLAEFDKLPSLERDAAIRQDALSTNAILITGDNSLKAFTQAVGLFCLHV
jgi:ribonuclease HII